MGLAVDEALLFEQHEHGPNSAGVRRHPLREFALSKRLAAAGERRQEDKLVGGDALLGKLRVGAPMQRQVGGAKRERELVFGGHRPISQIVRIRMKWGV